MNEIEKSLNPIIKLEHTYTSLPNHLFTKQMPAHVPSPKLIVLNTKLAQTLGMDVTRLQSDAGTQFFSGNGPFEEPPIAQAYAGHQFGYFTKLGDGRALLLGEYITPHGEKYDVQLKGSGRTPYSRGGDGKAALGPMLREYIISEAMDALGIPTTRSLSVVTTGEMIQREVPLEGAILTRIAKSHIRVGTFQYVAKWGTINDLKALADYTLERLFNPCPNQSNPYLYLLEQVVKRQASLIAKWQLVGFIHGVMNTDNMTISGETIDYGPCAFMDIYDPKTVFSSIDREGRYAYGQQPIMAGWDLARFAETLLPLLHSDAKESVKIAQETLNGFKQQYDTFWIEGMCAKLGLQETQDDDLDLIQSLLHLMETYKADYTNTFRLLTLGQQASLDFSQAEDFKTWETKWQNRLNAQAVSKENIQKLMMTHNPVVIPRNHKVEEALAAATNHHNYKIMNELLKALRSPYDYTGAYAEDLLVVKQTSCGYKTFCGT